MSTITINVTSSSSVSSSFTLPGDFTSIFYPGYVFQLTNQQNQNLTYTTLSSVFEGGVTQVNVGTAIQGSIISFTTTPGAAPYVSGYYQNVLTNGGSGNSAIVNVTVVGPGTINALGGITGGTGYLLGNYVAVPLMGGTGTGATASISVNSAGAVYAVTIMNPGTGYTPGDVLSVNPVPNGVLTVNTIVQPTGGTITAGTYTGVALTGGTGTGALATITVTGSQITSVVITTGGSGYSIGDTLGYAGVGIGTGGTVIVSTIQTYLGGTGSGFAVPVVNILTSNPLQVTVTLADGGVGYVVGNTITFSGPFGANTVITPTAVTTNELGTITLFNQNPMFRVNQTVYVLNELPAQCYTNRWWPATPQAPAIQSGTVLQSIVTATDSSNSPVVTYVIRLSGQAGTQTFPESNVYVDKPTAIAAYEALSL